MKFSVTVHPNSKNPRVEKGSAGSLHVYVAASPQQGKANQAVVNSLAKYFNKKKSEIFITHGQKSKNKVVQII